MSTRSSEALANLVYIDIYVLSCLDAYIFVITIFCGHHARSPFKEKSFMTFFTSKYELYAPFLQVDTNVKAVDRVMYHELIVCRLQLGLDRVVW